MALTRNKKIIIGVFLIILSFITLLTSYYGSTDTGDYADTAKYFANKYSADIRSSHSYLLGFLLSPFVKLTESFIIFKIANLIIMLLIIYSLYRISNRNEKTLWLALLSPIMWYSAPWISPIPLAALILLWAYFFINKFDKSEEIKHLIYSGLLIGLGWAIWDTIFYLGFILAGVYIFNKKFYHAAIISGSVLIGLMPRLILDQFLFNFAFFSTIKTFLSGFVNLLFGGISGMSEFTPKRFFNILGIFLALPLFFWKLYRKDYLAKNKKIIIFITLSILLILANPQMRYVLAIAPIMLLLISKEVSNKEFRIYLILSIALTLAFITPYAIQMNYSLSDRVEGVDFSDFLTMSSEIKIGEIVGERLEEDLDELVLDYPDETFLVGNSADSYQTLAHYYWGEDVKEFVSIQDYELFMQNKTSLFEKRFMPAPNIDERRQIWVAGGISRNINDETDYGAIEYALGIGGPISVEGFKLVKNYGMLYISKKA